VRRAREDVPSVSCHGTRETAGETSRVSLGARRTHVGAISCRARNGRRSVARRTNLGVAVAVAREHNLRRCNVLLRECNVIALMAAAREHKLRRRTVLLVLM
jgi:hypothetical protein